MNSKEFNDKLYLALVNVCDECNLKIADYNLKLTLGYGEDRPDFYTVEAVFKPNKVKDWEIYKKEEPSEDKQDLDFPNNTTPDDVPSQNLLNTVEVKPCSECAFCIHKANDKSTFYCDMHQHNLQEDSTNLDQYCPEWVSKPKHKCFNCKYLDRIVVDDPILDTWSEYHRCMAQKDMPPVSSIYTPIECANWKLNPKFSDMEDQANH